MAKKQLNLDMPLLSVRRLPSKLSSSSSSDERKSSSNPRSSTGQSSLSNLYTPESDLTQFSKPAAVPFLWEQIPGRPKEEPDAKSECPVESWRCTPPRLPPGRIRTSGELFDERRLMKSQVSASFPYDLSALEMENDSIQDIYCDALETLSQTESLSFDCRFVRSTRTSVTDSQTRDFMMRRFLPAAKAMVIDAPTQYVSQKHSGQLDQLNKINEERISLIKQNQQVKDSETENDDEEDDGDDCVDAIKKPAKIRGIFAKFCLRNSLCLLNPSSGMKSKKKHVPTSSSPAPAKEVVSRMSRSSYSGPLPRLNNAHGSKPPSIGANRMSFSGELLRNQSMIRGNGFVTVPKIVRKPSTTSSFEKMYGLDHHPLSIMRSSHELEKKKSNVCYPTDEIEEEMFSQDYNTTTKVSVAVGNEDNGKSQNQLGSLDRQVDHDDGLKSSSKEVQDESIMNCSPLTPPLPKSPSESWLWQAIPSISLKSHTKKQNGRVSISSPNWETIVKTSNKHRDHVRYSEELIPRISQHSKA